MLDALRRGAQGWLAKLLFALLIVSFGVFWNVSDSIRQVTQGAVATVGGRDITVQQFQRAFQRDLQALGEQIRQKITTEQALAFGLDKQTLDQLIAQQAVQRHTEQLGLALSDETLAEGVRKDPGFAAADGKFSRVILENVMRNLNVSERGFLALRREDEMRRQLIDSMRGAIVAPVPAVIDLNAYNEETRTIELVTIDKGKVKPAEPDDAKLKETYEGNKSRFMTPEYRKIAALLLNADDLKKEVTLTDDELKTAYTETKDTYDKPERRRLQQIPFKDKAAADAARKALVEGKKNFMDVAKEAGAKEEDVNLGLVSKKQMIDDKIADAAFKLDRDKVSDVIEGKFATVLIRAIEIQAGEESTFEGSKEKVRDALAKKRASAMLHDRIDLVEEGRNAGKTLADIAKEQKLRFVEVEAVDKDNKTPDGKTAIEQPDADKLLAEAFKAQPGDPQDVFELAPESYAWFNVVSISETKQKPFDEVKDKVREVYTELETSRLLNDLAKGFVRAPQVGRSDGQGRSRRRRKARSPRRREAQHVSSWSPERGREAGILAAQGRGGICRDERSLVARRVPGEGRQGAGCALQGAAGQACAGCPQFARGRFHRRLSRGPEAGSRRLDQSSRTEARDRCRQRNPIRARGSLEHALCQVDVCEVVVRESG